MYTTQYTQKNKLKKKKKNKVNKDIIILGIV